MMRAITVHTTRHIAIVAENAKTFWKVVVYQPVSKIRAASAYFCKVFSSTAIDVINSEKLIPIFTATSTMSAIVLNHLFSAILTPFSGTLIVSGKLLLAGDNLFPSSCAAPCIYNRKAFRMITDICPSRYWKWFRAVFAVFCFACYKPHILFLYPLGHKAFRLFFYVAGLEQIELTGAVDQIAFAAQPLKHYQLALTSHERHFLPPAHRPDTDLPLVKLVGHKALIEREGSKGLEAALRFAVNLVGVSNFGEHAHHHIRAKLKLLTNVVVAQLVKRELTEYLRAPRNITHVVAGSICGLKRLLEQCVLLRCRLELELGNQFHTDYFTKYRQNMQSRKEKSQLPHRVKTRCPR